MPGGDGDDVLHDAAELVAGDVVRGVRAEPAGVEGVLHRVA